MKHILFGAAFAALTCTATQAAVVINASETGGNVVFSASGSIDLDGAALADSYPSYNIGVIPGSDNWYYAEGSGGAVNGYAFTSFAGPFGTTSTFFNNPTLSSGEDFAIWGQGGITPQLLIGAGYTSGFSFSGGLEYDGASFSSLGLTPGTYVYTLPNDTITLVIGTSAVPEPASLALIGLGLALVGARTLRRRA